PFFARRSALPLRGAEALVTGAGMALRALAGGVRCRAAAAARGRVGQATAWPRSAGPALRLGTRGLTTAEKAAREDIHSKYAAVFGDKVPAVAPGGATATPSATSAAAGTSDAALARLEAFYAEVISTNWADYLTLVYAGPFWEAEFAKLTAIAQPHMGGAEQDDDAERV
ncbi:unnamed protein product, partial [Prorocentrum cordatum]